ncbi:hypothetical protein ACFCX4_00870 [Kitasatospora sp. NPDC056327]|uniref:hypothetical protein n=1 Tax=Kitasatospora sp. NPDC056327 TaxID=3345785 RepID=UPI0035DCAE4E
MSDTALAPVLRDPGPGLVVLEPDRARLFQELDALFTGIADRLAGRPVLGPALLPAEGLARLDYFRNFPHLGIAAARFGEETIERLSGGLAPQDLGPGDTAPTGYMLPSATCYGLLLALEGAEVGPGLRLTAVGRCFRNETHYEGLRRLWGFHMREVLYVGTRDGAAEHLARSRELILALAGELGLELGYEPANDPFFDKDGPRARLTRLDPVKHEFTAPDGTAIASVNRHRNFFGERLALTSDGATAHSTCTAFGVERWVHAMLLAHGDAGRALERVAAVRAARAGDRA